jgi:hypothetical protein
LQFRLPNCLLIVVLFYCDYFVLYFFSRFDESTGKMEAKALTEPEVCGVNKQEEQMGIFQILDALGEAADVLPNTSF